MTSDRGTMVVGNLLVATEVHELGRVAKVVETLEAAKDAEARHKALLVSFEESTGIGAVVENCQVGGT